MEIIKQEEIEARIANAHKPLTISNSAYPLNGLDDRIFEILTYSLFKKRIEINYNNIKDDYDNVLLMQGVGEKVFLLKKIKLYQ